MARSSINNVCELNFGDVHSCNNSWLFETDVHFQVNDIHLKNRKSYSLIISIVCPLGQLFFFFILTLLYES